MAITFTTVINQVEGDATSGDVDTIHYSIQAVDGAHSASAVGTVGTLDCDPLLDYNTLTEAQAITCVEEKLDLTAIHDALTAQINEKITPSKVKGLPWE